MLGVSRWGAGLAMRAAIDEAAADSRRKNCNEMLVRSQLLRYLLEFRIGYIHREGVFLFRLISRGLPGSGLLSLSVYSSTLGRSYDSGKQQVTASVSHVKQWPPKLSPKCSMPSLEATFFWPWPRPRLFIPRNLKRVIKRPRYEVAQGKT